MKALIAMSGGVDSSVAALLMTQMGYECVGCTMHLHERPETERTCASSQDTEDARNTAARLGMDYQVFHYEDEFRRQVIDRFIASYWEGKTPNPCIYCNQYMKFTKLHEEAKKLGCDLLVTGHYAQIEQKDGRYYLKKAVDLSKDQSYVLYSLTQQRLAHTFFPLGQMRKEKIRQIAMEHGLVSADKPDSQDICFVPDGDYASVIERYSGLKSEPGKFIDSSGTVLGTHKGIIHYTIGQRKGLGISSTEPYFVCEIRPQTNEVVLGRSNELFRNEVLVEDFNWISGTKVVEPVRCKAKIRYRQVEQPATLFALEAEGQVKLVFDEPQRAVTKGQVAVAYDGEYVIGGGIIV